MSKQDITFHFEFDMKNDKVREFFEKKTKEKATISLEEYIRECSVPLLLKSYQSNSKKAIGRDSSIKKWSTAYEVSYEVILNILMKQRGPENIKITNLLNDKVLIGKLVSHIKDTFQRTYFWRIPLLDAVIKASGGSMMDGRKKKSYEEIKSLQDKMHDELFKREVKHIQKAIAILKKSETKPKKLKRSEILSEENPAISYKEMVNLQAMELFNCLRKYIPEIDCNDKILNEVIADLFNQIYQVNSFAPEKVKDFRKNAKTKFQPKNKK
jgi:hypothetical protein